MPSSDSFPWRLFPPLLPVTLGLLSFLPPLVGVGPGLPSACSMGPALLVQVGVLPCLLVVHAPRRRSQLCTASVPEQFAESGGDGALVYSHKPELESWYCALLAVGFGGICVASQDHHFLTHQMSVASADRCAAWASPVGPSGLPQPCCPAVLPCQ